jgi:hypothetical protein
MKTNNTIAPFDSVQVPGNFRFTFLHSDPGKFFHLAKVRALSSSSRVAIFPKHAPFPNLMALFVRMEYGNVLVLMLAYVGTCFVDVV